MKEAQMHRIFQHKFLLPENLLMRGRANVGDLGRLHVVLKKLLAGTAGLSMNHQYLSASPTDSKTQLNVEASCTVTCCL